jgi:hypothetical protein
VSGVRSEPTPSLKMRTCCCPVNRQRSCVPLSQSTEQYPPCMCTSWNTPARRRVTGRAAQWRGRTWRAACIEPRRREAHRYRAVALVILHRGCHDHSLARGNTATVSRRACETPPLLYSCLRLPLSLPSGRSRASSSLLALPGTGASSAPPRGRLIPGRPWEQGPCR